MACPAGRGYAKRSTSRRTRWRFWGAWKNSSRLGFAVRPLRKRTRRGPHPRPAPNAHPSCRLPVSRHNVDRDPDARVPHVEQEVPAVDEVDVAIVSISPAGGPGVNEGEIVSA